MSQPTRRMKQKKVHIPEVQREFKTSLDRLVITYMEITGRKKTKVIDQGDNTFQENIRP